MAALKPPFRANDMKGLYNKIKYHLVKFHNFILIQFKDVASNATPRHPRGNRV